jgi:hypothetical protein
MIHYNLLWPTYGDYGVAIITLCIDYGATITTSYNNYGATIAISSNEC